LKGYKCKGDPWDSKELPPIGGARERVQSRVSKQRDGESGIEVR